MAETAGGSGVLAVPTDGALALFADRDGAAAGLDERALAEAAAAAAGRALGRPVASLYARQEHTRLTYTFSAAAELEPGAHLVGTCDALITAEPATALVVRTADCLPVAIAGGGAVAMVHAGWRGLAADILGAVVGRLRAEFGVGPGALAAIVGVGVGPCHYRVGPEVTGALARLDASGAGWRGDGVVDLAAFAAGRLTGLGLDPARVRVLPGCTACSPAYHSVRRDGPAAGRQWSAIILT
ncbi:MAG: polyphenol oxidase family protein [Thermoanaerobaculaceae bacterium]|nr:polyphenol oxidase family protein [Thermoanaerobaculaceae bacterium]TAM52353.1 MAG: laccase domain-containing protein [Acidobacteriota bacterium]